MIAGGQMSVELAAQDGTLPIAVLLAGFVNQYSCFHLILIAVRAAGGQDGVETFAAMVACTVLLNQSRIIAEC